MAADSDPAAAARVSVVVVSARDAPRLLRCLAAVLRESGAVALEIVVVLNAAEPALRDALERELPAARIVASQVALGFAAAVNLGVRHARGELLQILHDDTIVHPGWLRELDAALAEHPRAGAAGSLLIGPDGAVQTAGHVIWRDGRTQPPWHDAPRPGELDAVVVADYCASSALLVRREAWEATGGFDEQFHPVQYVDADFAMALRRCGWISISARRSHVFHERGGTGSHPLRMFAAQRNRERFVAKWAEDLLEQEPFADDPAALERARDATQRRARAVLASPPSAATAPSRRAFGAPVESDGERLARERDALLRDLDFKTAYVEWLEPFRVQADELWARLVASERAAAEREAQLTAERDALRARAQTLDAIEAGGWWRLRSRLLPLLRVATRVRRRLLNAARAPARLPTP
ncbi:MAG: hypothetical protein QOE31_1562, partial [Solirubrobacteraceae bacterium]|nr:hypothetical protein [Solirubrobacteraceae bacterium]